MPYEQHNTDVLVILPLEEELDAFSRALHLLGTHHIYAENSFEFEFNVSTTSRRVLRCAAATIQNRHQNRHRSYPVVETQQQIERFRPRLVVVCGIAMSGFSTDVQPGHVNIASNVFGLYDRKDTQYNAEAHDYDSNMAERFYSYWRTSRTVNPGKDRNRDESDKTKSFEVHFKPLACRDELISGQTERKRIVDACANMRKTGAYDMESHFILQGCSYPIPTPAVVIRGISDDGENKQTVTREFRADVVASCAKLIMGALENNVPFGGNPPPAKSPYSQAFTFLLDEKPQHPYDILPKLVGEMGEAFDVLDTNTTIEKFFYYGERSKKVIICLDNHLLFSDLYGQLENLFEEMGDGNSSIPNEVVTRIRERLAFFVPSGYNTGVKPLLDSTGFYRVFDSQSLRKALDKVLASIAGERSQMESINYQDGFAVEPTTASVTLICNGRPRRFGREDRDRPLYAGHEMSPEKESQLLACMAKLYSMFRDTQQCLLHAELTGGPKHLSVENTRRIAFEHLKHGMSILETKGRRTITDFQNVSPLGQDDIICHVYNSTFSCVQRLIGQWPDAEKNDSNRVSDLCVMVGIACHWLLESQKEMTESLVRA